MRVAENTISHRPRKSGAESLRSHLVAATNIRETSADTALSFTHREKLRKLSDLLTSLTLPLCALVSRTHAKRENANNDASVSPETPASEGAPL